MTINYTISQLILKSSQSVEFKANLVSQSIQLSFLCADLGPETLNLLDCVELIGHLLATGVIITDSV